VAFFIIYAFLFSIGNYSSYWLMDFNDKNMSSLSFGITGMIEVF